MVIDFFGVEKKPRKSFSSNVKEEVLLTQNSKCKKCGIKFSSTIRPHYDHKNGNRSDNRKTNLQALCANCHDHKSRKETTTRAVKKSKKNDSQKGIQVGKFFRF